MLAFNDVSYDIPSLGELASSPTIGHDMLVFQHANLIGGCKCFSLSQYTAQNKKVHIAINLTINSCGKFEVTV